MDSLPQELKREIAMALPFESLNSFCRSSNDLSSICRSGQFWEDKLHRDYPDLPFEQNIIDQRRSYYTAEGIVYRALYSVSHLLYPLVQAGRRQLEQLLRHKINELYFLGPFFPYPLKYGDNENGNYIASQTRLILDFQQHTPETVPWKIIYQEAKPYPAKNFDAGVMPCVKIDYLKEVITKQGVGNVQAAVDFLLSKGFIPYDNRIRLSKEQLTQNYNYFVIDIDKATPIAYKQYETAVSNLPTGLREFPGMKDAHLTRTAIEGADPRELARFSSYPTQLLEYTTQDLSFWRNFIERDFPVRNLPPGTVNDYKLYYLLSRLELYEQQPLQHFLERFRQILSQGEIEPERLHQRKLTKPRAPNSTDLWLIKPTLPLRLSKEPKHRMHYILADAIRINYFIESVPNGYHYRIELVEGSDLPYLPNNSSGELLEWLDDLERDYACLVPIRIQPEDVIGVPGAVFL